jgi:uncharacterized protein (DUF58 family)
MLYPDFKELVSFEAHSGAVNFALKNKSMQQMSGDYASVFRGQGMDFDEVREYRYGDDVRNIDWRVSARLNNTHIKVFKEERERNVLICVDKNDHMVFGTRGTFKNVQAARAAAILAFAANKNKDKVGFYIFGNQKKRFTFEPPSERKSALFRGLRNLSSDADFKESFSLSSAFINLKRININPNIVFVISDFRDANDSFFKNMLSVSRRSEFVFINVYDQFDAEIPDIGGLLVSDGKHEFLANTSSTLGRNRYNREFMEHQEYLQKKCASFGIRLINIKTSDDVLSKITSGFRRFKH